MIYIKLIFLLSFVSCAKLSYLTEQGMGQLKLQWRGKKIEKVLNDPEVKEIHKEKLRKIKIYKKYFYEYFDQEPSNIYSKVTFLEGNAVTHLVIASLYNKVEPLKTSFPFMGAFPYLGFFKESSAIKYQEKLEKKSYHTYKRPVYAYSTLGKLQDRVLSSFFQYSDEGLAELIFHELFHTIFFIKSNVDLNENLANYFGKEMMYEYFGYSKEKKVDKFEKTRKNKELRLKIVELINIYKKNIEKIKIKDVPDSYERLDHFLENSFKPEIKKFCNKEGIEIKKCYPLEMKWNHASFAAFMTYEKKGNFITNLREKYQIKDLRSFYKWINQKYNEYKKTDKKVSFTNYLEKLL